MKSVLSPLALQALTKARLAGRHTPAPRPKTNSRTADKFVIRGYEELFNEVAGMASHEGRSINSEVVAAIFDALQGHVRSKAMLHVLKRHLGNEISRSALDALPVFRLEQCKVPKLFNVRLPDNVRDTLKDRVLDRIREEGRYVSMNEWTVKAVADWVQIRREQYALLSAAIAVGGDLAAVLPELDDETA